MASAADTMLRVLDDEESGLSRADAPGSVSRMLWRGDGLAGFERIERKESGVELEINSRFLTRPGGQARLEKAAGSE